MIGAASVSFETAGAAETAAFGTYIAERMAAGDFVALDGDLAAGKTCLTGGLAVGLGFRGVVTSPTFTLLHLYEGGRLPLYHFDLYRLASPDELEGLGYEDYFYGEGLCVVEWSGRAADYLPSRRIEIRLERIASERIASERIASALAHEGEQAGDAGQEPAYSADSLMVCGFVEERRRITVTPLGGDGAWRQKWIEALTPFQANRE